MKKRFALLLAIMILAGLCQVRADTKMVNYNSGFEQMIRSMPANWYLVGILKPEVKFSTDSKVKHSGKHSVRTTITELTGRLKSFGPPNWAQDVTKNVPAGKKIRLVAYVKTRDVDGIAPIAVQCWNNEKISGFGTTQHKFPISGTTDWKKVSFEMQVPKDTVKIRILCMLSGTGTAWFDDVKVMVIK